MAVESACDEGSTRETWEIMMVGLSGPKPVLGQSIGIGSPKETKIPNVWPRGPFFGHELLFPSKSKSVHVASFAKATLGTEIMNNHYIEMKSMK